MFVMPSLQTAPSREETCILNLAGTRDWVSGANCKETQWFQLFLIRGSGTNPISEPGLISEIWKWGKEKRWINLREKAPHWGRGSAYDEPDLVYWKPLHRRASMISVSLFLLLIPAATGQEYFWMTKPDISVPLTPGVSSTLREKPLFPHQPLAGTTDPYRLSSQNENLQHGFAFLQIYRTGCTVQLQWNSVGSTD